MPAIRRSWREEGGNNRRRSVRPSSSNSWLVNMFRSRDRNTFITVIILAFLIMLTLLSYAVFGQQTSAPLNSSNLLTTFIVFRHGERAPDKFYPKDPYQELRYWPEGIGQLTMKGKVELYELGKKLRSQYSSFLSERYSNEDLQMRSSYADRCQMSALALLAGLYPPVDTQIWNQQLLWQPIPINSVPRIYDNLIVIGQPCKNYAKLKAQIQEEVLTNFTTDQKQLLEYLTVHSGMNVSTLSDIESLYFTLRVEADNGLKLPEWSKQVFPEKMKPLAELMQTTFAWNKKMKRFASGEMLREWRNVLTAASNEGYGKVKKMYLYSGHDLTLVCLKRSLGLELVELPNYGASLHVQLWHSDQYGYTVKVEYYSSVTSSVPENVMIPECPSCSLDKFLEIINPIVTENWVEECEE